MSRLAGTVALMSCVGLLVAGCGGSGNPSTAANPFAGAWWINSGATDRETLFISGTGQIYENDGQGDIITGSITSQGLENVTFNSTDFFPLTFQGLAATDSRGHLVAHGTFSDNGQSGAYILDLSRKF